MLWDNAFDEIVVNPFVVLRDMPAADARFELMSAVRDVDVMAPATEILVVKDELPAVNCV